MLSFFRARRRKRLRAQPAPLSWERILTRLPFYRALTSADRAELVGHMQVFLYEKRFEGAQGFVVTDEIALLIAAQACLLLLHRETEYYPLLKSIIVYPNTYVASRKERRAGGIESERHDVMYGESWSVGAIVLSWAQARTSALRDDGVNLVIHEFAHQLDMEDGFANGAPILGDHVDPAQWSRVMREGFEQLRYDAEHGHQSVLDAYGAESPAEFFSVASEAFFEMGRELKERNGELYEQLRLYYQQDPAGWRVLGERGEG